MAAFVCYGRFRQADERRCVASARLKRASANPSCVLAHHAGERAGGSGVEALGHAAGEIGFAAGEGGIAHGFGHEHGVLSFGDGGVHQEAVRAKFHRKRRVRGGAYACVYDHRDFGDAFAKDAKVGGILDAETRADRSRERHDGRGASVDEFAGGDEVVVRVREDDETFLDEDARSFDELLGVREKSLLIADDFELDPVGEADFASEACGANGFVGRVTGGGVGQDEHFFAVDEIEERFFRAIGKVDAANRDGDHVRAGGGVSARHLRKRAILASAHDQPGTKRAARNDKFVCHRVLMKILDL